MRGWSWSGIFLFFPGDFSEVVRVLKRLEDPFGLTDTAEEAGAGALGRAGGAASVSSLTRAIVPVCITAHSEQGSTSSCFDSIADRTNR